MYVENVRQSPRVETKTKMCPSYVHLFFSPQKTQSKNKYYAIHVCNYKFLAVHKNF